MRVTSYFGKKTLHILIDSGTTHNFLDLTLARKLGCRLDHISAQSVTIADGNQLPGQFICKGFKWRFQGAEFTSDMLVISLGAYDLVLGIQWLSTMGTVKWDFKKLQMEFQHGGRFHFLRGMKDKGVRVVDGAQMAKSKCNAIQLCLMQVPVAPNQSIGWEVKCHSMKNDVLPAALFDVLLQFDCLFQDPQCNTPVPIQAGGATNNCFPG